MPPAPESILLTAAFEHAPFGIAVVADDGRLLNVNPAFAAMTRRSPAWLLQRELTEIGLDGLEVDVHVAALEDGRSLLFAEDISERLATERELIRRATHDGLTGLPNRATLLDRLAQAVARRNRDGTALSLLFLDVDDFNGVNEALGHRTGDVVLASIARGLESELRPGDSIARYGGDEFVAVCERTGWVEAELIATRLAAVTWNATPQGGIGPRVSVSVGLAVATGPSAVQAEQLIERADADMYRIKRRQRHASAARDGSSRRSAKPLPPQPPG